MKIIMLVLIALTGCASLQDAGRAEYAFTPIVIDGRVICCAATIKNGKEIDSLKMHIEKRGSNYVVEFEERGVTAFKGQSIAAGVGTKATSVAGKVAGAAILSPAVPIIGAAVQ